MIVLYLPEIGRRRRKIMNLLYLVVPPALLYISYIALRVFFKRTRSWWIKKLFPLGYAIYNSRIGYSLHLRKLKSKKSSPHSIVGPTSLAVIKIIPLAVLDDNYAYLVIDTVTDMAVAVDPSDPGVVMKAVVDNHVTLKGVLTTHKHWDHSGGNYLLRTRFPELKIYGSSYEQVPGANSEVKDGDIVRFGRMTFTAMWTPGHTKGHMVYKLNNEPPCLFSGDHIFICGTGQMFEESAEKMLDSLRKVKSLPPNTLIFPGHEYTLRNLNFTVHLLPTNGAVQNKMKWVIQQRDRNLTTIPSILSEEVKYNPFFFTDSPVLRDALGMPNSSTPTQVLTELRRQKNIFDKTNI